jgi:hypothetical protein
MFLIYKMKGSLIFEIAISVFLILILAVSLEPVSLTMPRQMNTIMVPTLILFLVIFAAFLWKEKPGDERERLHRFMASRFAYFAGITTLVIGIIFQSINHSIDPWLVITAGVILLAKILGLIYGHFKH